MKLKRERKQWENEEILQIGRRDAHTDFKRHDNFSEKLSLNGEWKFLFLKAPEYSPEHFEEKNYVRRLSCEEAIDAKDNLGLELR